MSNFEQTDYDDNDDDFQQPKQAQISPAELRVLRKQAKEAEDLRNRIADMERREAIRGAGLSLNPRQEKALLASHDGEINADSLKATAAELGFIAAASQEPDTPLEEQAAHQRLSLVGGGGTNDGKVDFATAIANAKSEKEVMDLYRQAGGVVMDGSSS